MGGCALGFPLRPVVPAVCLPSCHRLECADAGAAALGGGSLRVLSGELRGDGGGCIAWLWGQHEVQRRVARARLWRCLDLEWAPARLRPTTLFVPRGRERAKASDGDDACGCRYPLGDVVLVIFPVSGLRVKTHVLSFGLGSGDALRRYPLGGAVVELRGGTA